jgi:hypothetical protein
MNAGLSGDMGGFVPAFGAYADPVGAGRKRATHPASALTLASPQAPASAETLPRWACTISSWHDIHPFHMFVLEHLLSVTESSAPSAPTSAESKTLGKAETPAKPPTQPAGITDSIPATVAVRRHAIRREMSPYATWVSITRHGISCTKTGGSTCHGSHTRRARSISKRHLYNLLFLFRFVDACIPHRNTVNTGPAFHPARFLSGFP